MDYRVPGFVVSYAWNDRRAAAGQSKHPPDNGVTGLVIGGCLTPVDPGELLGGHH